MAILIANVGAFAKFSNNSPFGCEKLCDEAFWYTSPSTEEVAAEIGFFTNLRKSGKWGFTPLHWAVRSDNSETVRLLLDAGSPVNAKANQGGTALLEMDFQRYRLPPQRNEVEIVSMLLDAGGRSFNRRL